MIKDFSGFIDESYLDSNHGPLYHYTTTYQFVEILESNTLKVSQFENPVKGISIFYLLILEIILSLIIRSQRYYQY
jgi:hypothetical protein